ncbi:MAG: M23 family metallopeptidase [Flammeovirgaceae bacterium]|nr:MAG: M23 family metallopeptidase [Flammeovirgaceae bacterium]
MANVHFKYNPHTCQYEPVYLTGKRLLKKSVIFFTLSLIIAGLSFTWYINRFRPIEEQLQQSRKYSLLAQWTLLKSEITKRQKTLANLAEQDDHNYRVILDLPALSSSQRLAGSGGAEKKYSEEVTKYPVILESYKVLDRLKHQAEVERQSFDQLNETADVKNMMWESRPAIQPIDNLELTRLHTTFGLRMHPIFKVLMDHKGLDFTAPKGAPVYATGDGRVSMAYFSGSYGNVIFIDHGFDYETRYAHLYKFNVRPGQFVKRGELIGYVGNTGISVSPHLHYEVYYKRQAVNPIQFFQRDLSNQEYRKLIQTAGKSESSLD